MGCIFSLCEDEYLIYEPKNFPGKGGVGFSNEQIKFLNFISFVTHLDIQHAGNKGEYHVPQTKFKVDGFIHPNIIIEFHGDYWHGNPKIYKPQEMNKLCNKTYGELFNSTKERENRLRECGYQVFSVWEYDWKEFTKKKISVQRNCSLEQIINKINSV